MKSKKLMAWIVMGSLVAPFAAWAEEPATSQAAPPHKTHHRHKKKAAQHTPKASAPSDSKAATDLGIHDMRRPEGNDAGQINLGTRDHTPGTTGTSGQ